jgi:hypothetical protein
MKEVMVSILKAFNIKRKGGVQYDEKDTIFVFYSWFDPV